MGVRQTRWSDILAVVGGLRGGFILEVSSPESRRSGSTKERSRALDLVTWMQMHR